MTPTSLAIVANSGGSRSSSSPPHARQSMYSSINSNENLLMSTPASLSLEILRARPRRSPQNRPLMITWVITEADAHTIGFLPLDSSSHSSPGTSPRILRSEVETPAPLLQGFARIAVHRDSALSAQQFGRYHGGALYLPKYTNGYIYLEGLRAKLKIELDRFPHWANSRTREMAAHLAEARDEAWDRCVQRTDDQAFSRGNTT